MSLSKLEIIPSAYIFGIRNYPYFHMVIKDSEY